MKPLLTYIQRIASVLLLAMLMPGFTAQTSAASLTIGSFSIVPGTFIYEDPVAGPISYIAGSAVLVNSSSATFVDVDLYGLFTPPVIGSSAWVCYSQTVVSGASFSCDSGPLDPAPPALDGIA